MKDLNNCEKQFLKYVLGEMLAGHHVDLLKKVNIILEVRLL